jgi:hypothetical protein
MSSKFSSFLRRVSPKRGGHTPQGVSIRTAILLSVVSTFLGATLTLFTASIGTLLSAHKENTLERRTQLRALLELAYGLPLEATSVQLKLWTTNEHGTAIEGLAKLKGQKYMDYLAGFRSDRIDRIRAIATVHFPELDPEARELVQSYYAAYSKAWQCSLDAATARHQTNPRKKVLANDLFPTIECMNEATQAAILVQSKVDSLVTASRTRLAVFSFDASRIPKKTN